MHSLLQAHLRQGGDVLQCSHGLSGDVHLLRPVRGALNPLRGAVERLGRLRRTFALHRWRGSVWGRAAALGAAHSRRGRPKHEHPAPRGRAPRLGSAQRVPPPSWQQQLRQPGLLGSAGWPSRYVDAALQCQQRGAYRGRPHHVHHHVWRRPRGRALSVSFAHASERVTAATAVPAAPACACLRLLGLSCCSALLSFPVQVLLHRLPPWCRRVLR